MLFFLGGGLDRLEPNSVCYPKIGSARRLLQIRAVAHISMDVACLKEAKKAANHPEMSYATQHRHTNDI